ncbi:MAG: hypothetical protein LBI72_14675 [Flavobacteriaceae bacterium]|jgi:hypothetical protein|nr:hypothetical protein [Flavobacteriaceae bacterium]
MKKVFLLGLSLTLFFASCTKSDDPFVEKVVTPTYQNGILILNEGGFTKNNASLNFVGYDLATMYDDIAKPADAKTLGDVAQSMAFNSTKAFIVMNNSNKIEIFNRYTLKYEATIDKNLSQPRYIALSNDEIYVTNWGSKSVNVFKQSDYSFVKEISLKYQPENLVVSNNKVYVQETAEWGATTSANKISIIDTKTKEVTKVITVEGKEKDKIDLQGIVAHGDFVYAISSNSYRTDFFKINNITDTQILTFPSGANNNAKNLRAENAKLYYTSNNKVFAWEINDRAAQKYPLLTLTAAESQDTYAAFYGFNVIDNKIYVANAGDYTGPSKIKVYDLQGKVLKEFKGGLLTNGFYNNFKY